MGNTHSTYVHTSLKYLIDGVLGKANTDIDTMSYLSDIVDMDENLQIEVFKLLWLAFKNVIADRVSKGLPISLPYLGTIKIKGYNKIALVKKQEISNELGYNDWKNIPKDKLEKASKEVNKRLNDEIKAKKLINGVTKKANHQVTKVMKLKLPKK